MTRSLRGYLLAGIITPIVVFVVFDTVSLYRGALASINTAYDRSLLASARTIGELLELDEHGTLRVEVPYTALEVFDAGNKGRLYYRINGFDGKFLSGYRDLPDYTRKIPMRTPYAALVDFYDAEFRGQPVRMAALYQAVTSENARGMALVQVAETLEIRETLAREILLQTLQRQALLILIVSVITGWVVTRALRPVHTLSDELHERTATDLSPVQLEQMPRELAPVVAAVNDVMQRLQRLMQHQRQFVRDASHQLRTPLAVLKTQVRNALDAPHGEVPRSALVDMQGTVERAIRLANQMLALAKFEQVQAQGPLQPQRLDEVVREVALDLSPLIGDKHIEFELQAEPTTVMAHDWMLRELTRNLLHNAIRETPPGRGLLVEVRDAMLRIADSGPGLPAAQRERLFEPFHTGHPAEGSGLGLAICRRVCDALGAQLALVDRVATDGHVQGLDATVQFRSGPAGPAQSAP